MGVEGRLRIDLMRGPDGSGEARITSSRPLGLTRAFMGKRIDETVRTLPLMFSVCGLAQGAAAAEASEQALAIEVPETTRRARQLLVLAETAREHLIRAVGDWSAFLTGPPEEAYRLHLMRAYEDLRRAIDPARAALSLGASVSLDAKAIVQAIGALASVIEELILGEPIARFDERRTSADLDLWQRPRKTAAQALVGTVIARGWSGAGNAGARFLPRLDDDELAALLLDADDNAFTRTPTWNGAPQETSALGRQIGHPLVSELQVRYGHGLLTRIGARLVEIAGLPDRMHEICDAARHDHKTEVHAASPRAGRGVAHVEAARGRLIHGIDADGKNVARYAILAPTEWNFHPEGGGREALSRIAGQGDDALTLAGLFVSSLDPCVAYEVRAA